MDLINAPKIELIRVTKKYCALKRKEATKLFFKAIATSSALLVPSRFHHKGSNLFKQSFVKLY
jgi:hypothetical protein